MISVRIPKFNILHLGIKCEIFNLCIGGQNCIDHEHKNICVPKTQFSDKLYLIEIHVLVHNVNAL